MDELALELLKQSNTSPEDLPKSKFRQGLEQMKKDWMIYVMLIPVVVFFYLFRYRPIGGILVAFKRTEDAGILIGERYFAGFFNFKEIFVGSNYAYRFWRAFRNTFTLSAYGLFFGFPIPIVIALMFSEIKSEGYRAFTQIISYLPKFISTVIITSILIMMFNVKVEGLQAEGFLHQLMQKMGIFSATTKPFVDTSKYFRSIYIISGIWEGAGYGSIVYFAAIMSISPTNYQAAKIDGANKLDQIRHVTLPGMAPTLIIMLILRIGEILSVGYEKILLLTNLNQATVQETAEVISTFVISITGQFGGGSGSINAVGVAAAADMFNSVIAMLLVLGSNFIAKKVSNTSLF
ncbi:MAG: ABC transporter permease subunit [Acholeplasmatales bacterium]|jgi:putative aldouronate transport system permease protein|nr:ABC transporter permease subunit [Acholeplasmatales bacterium]